MYVVVLVDKDDKILHAVYYENRPSYQDIFFLGQEIATDEEFNHIVGDINAVYVESVPDLDYNEFANELFGEENDENKD